MHIACPKCRHPITVVEHGDGRIDTDCECGFCRNEWLVGKTVAEVTELASKHCKSALTPLERTVQRIRDSQDRQHATLLGSVWRGGAQAGEA